jgi:uncharacterized protein (DUF2267 family)
VERHIFAEQVLAMSSLHDLSAEAKATEAWVDDLMQLLGWHERQRAYLALIATLHALRDCLGRDETVYVGAQLPTLLRGLYYEGWHPRARLVTSRSAFLERILDGMHRDVAVDPEQVARAVLALLATHMPAAELEDAKAATPPALHNLWPS